MISSDGALLLANPDGEIILKKNETRKLIPASTLKILTALAAIRYLGHDYRFSTEFYLDKMHNLKIKGYGDPVLISESIQSISIELAERARDFNNLILDDTFFSQDIFIPGRGSSTNPYDAPAGALCANFNTVFFNRSKTGHIVSAEPVTPMTPYARQKIEKQGLKGGRCSIFSNQREGAIYAGELFLQFLGEQGVKFNGKIVHGTVNPNDRLIYTYRSEFTLRDILIKMMEFSNNFIANQVLISLGAHVYSPPGTLDKGIRLLTAYAKDELLIEDAVFVEGSGISRKNRISALDMFKILKHFAPHRDLLKNSGQVLYKTGTLDGIRTLAGYILNNRDEPCYFVIFLNSAGHNIDLIMECVKRVCSTG